MPTYTFINNDTGESEDHLMSLSEREQFLKDNPNYSQALTTPVIGDPVRMGVTKTPDGFNQLLKHAKKSHLHSTIQTRN